MSDTKHFNQLTPEQAELLAVLAEECGEVVQVIGKIQRHGIYSRHPNGGPTNNILLESEIGHVRAAARLLSRIGVVDLSRIATEETGKLTRIGKYLHHAGRALVAPATEKVAKVECPNCKQPVATNEEHVSSRNRDSFTCQPAASVIDTTKTVAYCDELEARYGQPAPPEPAAREMECGTADDDGPPDLDEIKQKARQEGFDDGYLAGRTYERNLAQPSRAAILPHGTKEGIWQK